MHWESIGNSENDNHCLNFKSNYDKMKITSIKVNLIKYFFMRNWVLKTLYSKGFTSIEVVFHCNGCIAFSGKFFSGGTSKEVRPLERGDSPRMSRRLRPDQQQLINLALWIYFLTLWKCDWMPSSLGFFQLTGLILGLLQANERHRCKVTPSLIGWAQT